MADSVRTSTRDRPIVPPMADRKEAPPKRSSGPDSWESWRMVLCCFSTTLLVGASTRSSAVLYVAIMETFEVSRGDAAWPVSLITGFVNFAGLLSGPLSTVIGLRMTCVLGGTMSVICLCCCYFANGIVYITVCFGVLNGIGIGLMYNLNPVILSHYFQRYKGLALGINYCGSSIAAMVFPKCMELLYRYYGLQGLFLLLGGMMLHTPVLSALMRKPSWRRKKMQAPDPARQIVRRLTISSVRSTRTSTITTQRDRTSTIGWEISSLRSRSTTVRSRATGPAGEAAANTGTEGSSLARDRSTSISVAGLSIGVRGNELSDLVLATDIGMGALPRQLSEENLEDLAAHSDLPAQFDTVAVREDSGPPSPGELILNAAQLAARSVSTDFDASKTILDETAAVNIEMEEELSLREIFCNPLFYLLIVSYLVFTNFSDILLAVMVDLLADKGIPQPTAIATIPLVSVTDMLGRVILPFVADKGLVNRKFTFAVNFCCLGGLAFAIPSAEGYPMLTALFLLVGWFYGSTLVMCTLVVSDILGVHNLAVANGLICSSVGFLSFGRPAFIGYFRDTVGSYNPMLYFWGTLCFSVALIWLSIFAILRCRTKHKP